MLRRVSVEEGSPRPGIPGLLGFSHRVTMVVSVGLVIAGVIASFAGWRQAVDSETRSEAQQLEVAAEGVAARLEAAVSTQRQLINDISGLFAASGIVTRDEFAVFAELARRTTPAPSLGLGFIRRVPAEDLAAFTAAARADGAPGFTPHPAGNRAEWAVLLYSEPAATLSSTWGLDVSTVEATRVALAEARDTGQPVLSAPLTLMISSGLSRARTARAADPGRWELARYAARRVWRSDRPTGS